MNSARQFVEVLSRLVDCESAAGPFGHTSPRESFAVKPRNNNELPQPRQTILTRTIESEIIPRLMLSHRQAVGTAGAPSRLGNVIRHDDVVEFARLTVTHDVKVAEAFIQVFRERGIPLERIFMQLLAPTAKHLGELWLADECSFSDVTVGLSRIYQLVHRFSPLFESEAPTKNSGESGIALLAPGPGEQHGLGLLLVEEFLRRDGWDVWAPASTSAQETVQAAAGDHYDMIGISVTCGALLDDLTSFIQAMRAQSRNPNVTIMVGGRFFNDQPSYVQRVGADGTDFDGSRTVHEVNACRARLKNS